MYISLHDWRYTKWSEIISEITSRCINVLHIFHWYFRGIGDRWAGRAGRTVATQILADQLTRQRGQIVLPHYYLPTQLSLASYAPVMWKGRIIQQECRNQGGRRGRGRTPPSIFVWSVNPIITMGSRLFPQITTCLIFSNFLASLYK